MLGIMEQAVFWIGAAFVAFAVLWLLARVAYLVLRELMFTTSAWGDFLRWRQENPNVDARLAAEATRQERKAFQLERQRMRREKRSAHSDH